MCCIIVTSSCFDSRASAISPSSNLSCDCRLLVGRLVWNERRVEASRVLAGGVLLLLVDEPRLVMRWRQVGAIVLMVDCWLIYSRV